jgi:hypothetical protein
MLLQLNRFPDHSVHITRLGGENIGVFQYDSVLHLYHVLPPQIHPAAQVKCAIDVP